VREICRGPPDSPVDPPGSSPSGNRHVCNDRVAAGLVGRCGRRCGRGVLLARGPQRSSAQDANAAVVKPAPLSPEVRKKAEALFKDVYGADFDKAGKSKVADERIAFAKQLNEAAKSAGDAALTVVLKEKAAEIAGADLSGLGGYLLALEQIAGLYEKVVKKEGALGTVKSGEALAGAYRDLAGELVRTQQFDAANKAAAKARPRPKRT
jgi:hypothetical protein